MSFVKFWNIDHSSVYREYVVSISSFLFHSTRLRMGRHSGVWVEEYFGAERRSSDGAFYLVRKCILSDTTSTAVVTPWQPTYAEKSILNEVTWLQTRSLFFAQPVLLPVTAQSHFRFCYLPGISKFQYRCLAEKWPLRCLKINCRCNF